MGRLSIYLPDELEARTKAVQPDGSTSQVIRAALERYLGPGEEPAYVEPPGDVAELLAAGVSHFRELAKHDYQDGYRAALKRLVDLDWYALAGFARDDFDLVKWAESWRSSMGYFAAHGGLEENAPDWFARVAADLGSLIDPIGFDEFNFRHTPPWERGYADGLRAGYEAALGAGAMDAGARDVVTDSPDEAAEPFRLAGNDERHSQRPDDVAVDEP